MNEICRILGIFLFIRAFICASAGCEPNCNLLQAYHLCLKQLDEEDVCFTKCTFEKAGLLDESGYFSKKLLNQTDETYPEYDAMVTGINWECWNAFYGNGTGTDLCKAAQYFEQCAISTLLKTLVDVGLF